MENTKKKIRDQYRDYRWRGSCHWPLANKEMVNSAKRKEEATIFRSN